MTRIPRSLLPDGTYHAMSRGVARSTIFGDDDDRRLFLQLVLKVVERWTWEFHVLCLMGNHYHFVIDASREALSAGMHRLNGVYAQSFNDRYNRHGHLFGGRFACRIVEGEDYLHDLCHYVLENPVRSGLCKRAQDWPWSWSRYAFEEG